MTSKKTTEVAVAPSNEVLAQLKNEFPQEQRVAHIYLPRLGMYTQDVTEGKGKAMKVVAEAGTFYTEEQTDEVDAETGKKVWQKTELGTQIDVTIIYQRKQLRYFDEADGTFTSSPVYDSKDEIVPLFCNGAEVDRGTPAELQAKYPGFTAKGKPKSKLEENKILYVLYGNKAYQMSLRGTSLFSFLDYSKKVVPPSVVTTITSEAMENGSISWNKMLFSVAQPLNAQEAASVLEKIRDIKETIAAEKAQYGGDSVQIIPKSQDDEAF